MRMKDDTLEFLGDRKKLSFQEREYMEIIWKKPDGISSEELYSAFQTARGTIAATLSHITDKGYVVFQKDGRNTIYVPLVSKLEYEQAVLKQKMKKYMGFGSLTTLIGMFCGKSELEEHEKEEIEELIKKISKEQ